MYKVEWGRNIFATNEIFEEKSPNLVSDYDLRYIQLRNIGATKWCSNEKNNHLLSHRVIINTS